MEQLDATNGTQRVRARRIAAGEHYKNLRARSPRATTLLERFGLERVAQHKVCRADGDGGVALPLFDASGEIQNVITLGHDLETTGLPGCPTNGGTLIGALAKIGLQRPRVGGRADVVVATGVASALTASLAWHADAVILGVLTAADYADVVPLAARRVKLAKGRLWLVVDDCDDGEHAAIEAARAAMALDLVLHRDVFIVQHDGFNTLNAAWRAGWSPP